MARMSGSKRMLTLKFHHNRIKEITAEINDDSLRRDVRQSAPALIAADRASLVLGQSAFRP
jgi:hypothetical protein